MLQQKEEPQALRPAPASLSFYPAEKKVSKENGGHGMEHVVREVSVVSIDWDPGSIRVLF
ncbi:MAG: hypothetical protein ACSLFH_01350 [Desulfuromonadales bacterium]